MTSTIFFLKNLLTFEMDYKEYDSNHVSLLHNYFATKKILDQQHHYKPVKKRITKNIWQNPANGRFSRAHHTCILNTIQLTRNQKQIFDQLIVKDLDKELTNKIYTASI